MSKLSVIGLGQMGATLAQLLLRAGHEVCVWNRTAAKAEALVREGATFAADPAQAIAAASIVVVCVHDYQASREILQSPGAASALRGKLLLQLSTGSPQDARDSEAWAHANGAGYIDGAIQVAPSQMGRPDTTLLVSGAQADFDRAGEVLGVFGGNIAYLGSKIAAAAVMDLATLSYVYGAILGFFQGVLFCEAEGLDLDDYGRIVSAMSPSYGEFLQHEAGVVRSGDYSVSESPLSISVEATARIEAMARQAGIATEVPALAASYFAHAAAAGHGGEELAALVKSMRAPQPVAGAAA